MTAHGFDFEWANEVTEETIDKLISELEANREYNKHFKCDSYMGYCYGVLDTGDVIMSNVGTFLDALEAGDRKLTWEWIDEWCKNAPDPQKFKDILVQVLIRKNYLGVKDVESKTINH